MTKRIRREKDRKFFEDRTTVFTRNGSIEFVGVHPASQCAGETCIIHNPVVPTAKRNLLWRSDRGFFEEICSCGIGHPTIESVEFWDKIGAQYNSAHGCCGEHCFSAGYREEAT